MGVRYLNGGPIWLKVLLIVLLILALLYVIKPFIAGQPPPEVRSTSSPMPTSTTAPPTADPRAFERAIFEEVNNLRAGNGVPPLEWDERVAAVARAHSEDMAKRRYFGHVTPDGVTLGERLQGAGLPPNGAENILVSSLTISVGDDVANWMSSPEHRVNLLDPNSHKTGVGIAIEGEEVYITQDFLY